MIDTLRKIEKELERMKEESRLEMNGTIEDAYTLGIHSGICKALTIVYKYHMEYMDKLNNPWR